VSQRTVLIATARVRPGCEAEFAAWQARQAAATAEFPGFVSSDMMPPSNPAEPWTIIKTFEDAAALDRWMHSPERAELIVAVTPLLDGVTFSETVATSDANDRQGTSVTEVIFTRVKPGKAKAYQEWSRRIQSLQTLHPGFTGAYVQPPAKGNEGGTWTTILRFNSTQSLEAWMNSPDRKAMIEEARPFLESEELMQLATSFPGWVPIDPSTGKGPPNWKTAMLVLLGLFPIVLLELRFLSPVLTQLGLHASLATFIGNCISVALTSFLTMPFFVKTFSWWLFPKNDDGATLKGSAILCALYACEVLIFWHLLPW